MLHSPSGNKPPAGESRIRARADGGADPACAPHRMNEPDSSLSGAEDRRQAPFLALEEPAAETWDQTDWAALLQHQLDAPVEVDQGPLPPALARNVRAVAGAEGLARRSFNDFFQHPHPPAALLPMVRAPQDTDPRT